MKKFCLPLIITATAFTSVNAHALKSKTAYGRIANVQILEKLVVNPQLEEIIQIMNKEGVTIYQVPVVDSNNQTHPFSFLPRAPINKFPELEYKEKEVDSKSALFVTQNEIPQFPTNIIFLASDAEPMTLFHEFTHHLFESQNHHETKKITEFQKNHDQLLSRFNFKTRKVMVNFSLLLSKQWRDEIKTVTEEYASSIQMGQGIIAAEEIAVENTLIKLMLKTKSPYLDLERAHQGIDGYSSGLIIRSESLVNNLLALADLVMTEGITLDSEATTEELEDWTLRTKKLTSHIQDYIQGPLANMKKQVQESKKILAILEKNKPK